MDAPKATPSSTQDRSPQATPLMQAALDTLNTNKGSTYDIRRRCMAEDNCLAYQHGRAARQPLAHIVRDPDSRTLVLGAGKSRDHAAAVVCNLELWRYAQRGGGLVTHQPRRGPPNKFMTRRRGPQASLKPSPSRLQQLSTKRRNVFRTCRSGIASVTNTAGLATIRQGWKNWANRDFIALEKCCRRNPLPAPTPPDKHFERSVWRAETPLQRFTAAGKPFENPAVGAGTQATAMDYPAQGPSPKTGRLPHPLHPPQSSPTTTSRNAAIQPQVYA
ncbi:hypothetical protein LXA43DRAFT_1067361 [Ganoderma leucocontextum]|nr:hypothetical protein LXA43DRAFT_1067361 [Ganoderma leucocontextum]